LKAFLVLGTVLLLAAATGAWGQAQSRTPGLQLSLPTAVPSVLSATAAFTPTATATVSPTPTSTGTSTWSPTITSTPTNTPTGTLTPSVTWTPSDTWTLTPTLTPTFTSTATSTPSPTQTSTSTPGVSGFTVQPKTLPGPVTFEWNFTMPVDHLQLKVFTSGFRLLKGFSFDPVKEPNRFKPGIQSMVWDGLDDRRKDLIPGTYFIFLTAKKGKNSYSGQVQVQAP